MTTSSKTNMNEDLKNKLNEIADMYDISEMFDDMVDEMLIEIETAISKARRKERERILRWHNLEKNKWSCVAQDEGQECCIDKLLTQKEKDK